MCCNMNFTYKFLDSSSTDIREVLKLEPGLQALVRDENPCITVGAFYGEQQIGLVKAYTGAEKDLHIATVYVNVEHWRKGVGTKLLTMLEEEAKEKGFDTLSLTVFEKNSRAKGLYNKMGFATDRVTVMGFETYTKSIN